MGEKTPEDEFNVPQITCNFQSQPMYLEPQSMIMKQLLIECSVMRHTETLQPIISRP